MSPSITHPNVQTFLAQSKLTWHFFWVDTIAEFLEPWNGKWNHLGPCGWANYDPRVSEFRQIYSPKDYAGWVEKAAMLLSQQRLYHTLTPFSMCYSLACLTNPSQCATYSGWPTKGCLCLVGASLGNQMRHIKGQCRVWGRDTRNGWAISKTAFQIKIKLLAAHCFPEDFISRGDFDALFL